MPIYPALKDIEKLYGITDAAGVFHSLVKMRRIIE